VIPLALDADEMVALHDDMRYGPYLMQPSAQLLTLDHEVLSDISDRVIDGQVDCKLDGKASTRTCGITLFDPGREVAIDGADAGDGAFFYDKMLATGVRFKGPRIGRWVHIPTFCGPITNGGRAGYTATVTAQGKERLAMGMVWDIRNYTAGDQKIDVIRDLLVQTGEAPSRVRLPDLTGRIPKDIPLERTDTSWPEVMDVSNSMNRQPMYDGRGNFRLRGWPDDPKVVFTDGNGGTILTHPEVTYDQYDGWNGVTVIGPTKRTGKRIEKTIWLPRNHPLSPWSRARGGVPYRKAYIVTNAKVRTEGEAEQVAQRYLRRNIREVVNVVADVMPNWLLEPGDVVTFRTPQLGNIEQVLREFSLPLTLGTPMSIGAVRYLTGPKRRPIKGGVVQPVRHRGHTRKTPA
jgi:hypothetical protein